jgi:DNA-binding CsgD family transcriptional regulator
LTRGGRCGISVRMASSTLPQVIARTRKPEAPSQKDLRLATAYSRGMSPREVARKHSVTRGEVLTACRRTGVKVRGRTEAARVKAT